VFRSFHTIKGGAGFMGLPALVAACHLTENLFDALRTGAAPVTPLSIEAALQASGFVADQLAELNNGAEPDSLPALPGDLEQLLNDAIAGKTDGRRQAGRRRPPAPAPPGASAGCRCSAGRRASADGLDWEGMYEAVMPAGSYPFRAAACRRCAAAAWRRPRRARPKLPPSLPKSRAAPRSGREKEERPQSRRPRKNRSVSTPSSSTRCWKWPANPCRPPTRLPCCWNA
jgi:two-component system chemotaxis sensor kinase CheA